VSSARWLLCPARRSFWNELRAFVQVVVLSDTFEQFAAPLLRQLNGQPSCATAWSSRTTTSWTINCASGSRSAKAVAAFKRMNYHVIAGGDSFNDTRMLGEANAGILFHAPDGVKQQFPQFPAVETYGT